MWRTCRRASTLLSVALVLIWTVSIWFTATAPLPRLGLPVQVALGASQGQLLVFWHDTGRDLVKDMGYRIRPKRAGVQWWFSSIRGGWLNSDGIPLWLLIAISAVITIALWLKPPRRGFCPACGYPSGSSSVCSECGKPLPARCRRNP